MNTDDLINVELTERRLAFTCEISTSLPVSPVPAVFRLASERLNRSRLARAQSRCRIVFRQKDMKGLGQAGFERAANLYTVTQWPAD